MKSLIEGITQKHRSDQVKIIFIPKKHYELDPSQYISVFLLNAVKNNSNDLKKQCIDTLDRFPKGMWEKALGWVHKCEKTYMDIEESESENEENKSEQADQNDDDDQEN